jgi:hypothetical protein
MLGVDILRTPVILNSAHRAQIPMMQRPCRRKKAGVIIRQHHELEE